MTPGDVQKKMLEIERQVSPYDGDPLDGMHAWARRWRLLDEWLDYQQDVGDEQDG